jgi:hypothetical protein
METFKIKALTDTVIKLLPIDSTQLLDSQKFSLAKNSEIAIKSYTLASNEHWQLELTSPVNGVTRWFTYQPHIEICGTVLEKIKNLTAKFKEIPRVYHGSTDQDRTSRGIFSCSEEDYRSEKVYLPFVLSSRRQTDQMVRQAYLLLPKEIRCNTAFLITDRFCQYPDFYIPYIQQKKNVVLIGSFTGIEKHESEETFEVWRREYHALQLLQLETSIELIQNLEKTIVDVVFAMGDSIANYATTFRKKLEEKYHHILKSFGLNSSQFLRPLPWGADETTLIAFARQLPGDFKLKVTDEMMSNPNCCHHYDGKMTTKELLKWELEELKITPVESDNFDAQVFIFDWKPESDKSNYKLRCYEPNSDQKQHDLKLVQRIKALEPNLHPKTIIIDVRNPNGAWDKLSIPPSDQFLAFGAWGSFVNSLAQTLAFAKLLHFYDKPDKLTIQHQLLLEAIAHDVFVIGHAEVQWQDSPLQKLLKKQPPDKRVAYTRGDYNSVSEVQKLFRVINQFVNERMSNLEKEKILSGAGNTQFAVVPQLWRMFESEVYASDGELSVAGVYREDLPPETFNPFQAAKNVKKFGLEELINEF